MRVYARRPIIASLLFMARVKIFALKQELNANRKLISDSIHSAVVMALNYPPEKKFHRFFPMNTEDFIYPQDRSQRYTIIEISLFEGRSVQAKKSLVRQLFRNFQDNLDISPNDLEITLFESPKEHWGIRGVSGDELQLKYQVNV